MLSPIGVVALVAIAAASIAVVVVQQACLMTIAFGVVRGVRVRVIEALWIAARRLGSILLIAARLVVRVLLLAAPFLAACGLTYAYLLTEFDINFYLTNRPPVFWVAATLIGVLLLVLAALLVPRLLGWTYALPLHLFEGVGAARVLGTSEERARGHRVSLAAALVGWFALSIVLSTVSLGVVGTLGRFLVPRFQGSMAPLLFVMGGLSLLWAVVNFIVTLIQTSTFALLVVRLYERHGGAAGAKLPDDMPEALGAGVALNLSFKKLLAGLAVASAVAGLVGYSLIAGVRMDDDVLVIAHRGAAGRTPENTLASVAAAIEDDADLVEIDVQETRDGRVVVIHDSDFKKIAGSGVKIWDADFDEVRELDIGSWFAPEFHAERVPTLEEVLDVAKGRARVNIELKYYGHDQRLEERVVQIVEEMGMASGRRAHVTETRRDSETARSDRAGR